MTKQLTIDKALSYGMDFALKKGADQVEGFSLKGKQIQISIEKNLPQITNGLSSGVSFRVVSNKNQGFGFTKTLTKERIESTIKVAIQNAKAKGKDPDFKSFPHPSERSVTKFDFDRKLESLTLDSLAEGFTTLIDTINGIKGLHYLQGQVIFNIQEESLQNSNGIDISEISGGLGGMAAAITTRGLMPNWTFEVKGGRSVDDFNFQELAEKIIEETQRVTGPKTMNFEKDVPIILEPEATAGLMGGLFSILAAQLIGDRIASGATPYSDQVGNQIASEQFTFVDNGIHPSSFTSSSYDAEGVPRERSVLIDKGILQSFLLDTYYGNKLGLESNGKSNRTSFAGFGDPVKTIPSIGATTIEILSGDSSKDEMIAETREGFLIRSLMGVHMSDFSSGRFAVTGFGWYIKNGEVKYPVQGISLSGMLPELIKNIDLISRERKFTLLAECPYLRFASVLTTAKKFDFKTLMALRLLKILTSLKIMKHPMIG